MKAYILLVGLVFLLMIVPVVSADTRITVCKPEIVSVTLSSQFDGFMFIGPGTPIALYNTVCASHPVRQDGSIDFSPALETHRVDNYYQRPLW